MSAAPVAEAAEPLWRWRADGCLEMRASVGIPSLVRPSLCSALPQGKPSLILPCMLLLGLSCAGATRVSTGAAAPAPCSRRSARSLVARIVVARGEERYTARTMLAYRRPEWVRGELYDGVGSLRASFILEGGALSMRLAGSDEIVTDTSDWPGWDELLGIPPGSSALFGLLPLVLDPWAISGAQHPPSPEVTATIIGDAVVRIRFTDDRPTDLTVVRDSDDEAVCTFEGGDGCLAGRRLTVDLPRHGVVVWITVEDDGDFPEYVPTDLLLGK